MNTRTEALIGKFAMDLLKERKVFVFGVGGVGGYVAEALARSGVGTVAVADFDTVEETNLNRQIIALKSTVGQNKAELMAARMRQINDKIVAKYFPEKIDETNIRYMMIEKYDYIIDAVDDVKAKVAIIKMAKEKKIPVISCMGTGNKIRPEKLKIADIKKITHHGFHGLLTVAFAAERRVRNVNTPDFSFPAILNISKNDTADSFRFAFAFFQQDCELLCLWVFIVSNILADDIFLGLTVFDAEKLSDFRFLLPLVKVVYILPFRWSDN